MCEIGHRMAPSFLFFTIGIYCLAGHLPLFALLLGLLFLIILKENTKLTKCYHGILAWLSISAKIYHGIVVRTDRFAVLDIKHTGFVACISGNIFSFLPVFYLIESVVQITHSVNTGHLGVKLRVTTQWWSCTSGPLLVMIGPAEWACWFW